MRKGVHKLLSLYRQWTNWLIHFQELESKFRAKFLQLGCWILRLRLVSTKPSTFKAKNLFGVKYFEYISLKREENQGQSRFISIFLDLRLKIGESQACPQFSSLYSILFFISDGLFSSFSKKMLWLRSSWNANHNFCWDWGAQSQPISPMDSPRIHRSWRQVLYRQLKFWRIR